jgi:hypothetical protein
MADDTTKPETENQSQPDAALTTDTTTDDKKPVPYTRFQEAIAEKNALKAKLDAIEKADAKAKKDKEQADARKLLEEGEFKKAHDQLAARLPDLETKAQKAELFETWAKDMLAVKLKTVSDDVKPLLEKLEPLEALKYIEEHPTIGKREAGSRSNLDGQANTGIVMTDEEMQTAKAMGVSPESFMRAKLNNGIPLK